MKIQIEIEAKDFDNAIKLQALATAAMVSYSYLCRSKNSNPGHYIGIITSSTTANGTYTIKRVADEVKNLGS